MSTATAVTWIFNFCATMSLPTMKGENALKAYGTLSFYLCGVESGWILFGVVVCSRISNPAKRSYADFTPETRVHCRHQ